MFLAYKVRDERCSRLYALSVYQREREALDSRPATTPFARISCNKV